ncbi:hypothetical protein ACIQRC_30105 [Streptomyces californicus]|uniref:hypothetical protein n=1 Tax=Streptomyces californicus TaxID=67351 RepID=UPI0037F3B142
MRDERSAAAPGSTAAHRLQLAVTAGGRARPRARRFRSRTPHRAASFAGWVHAGE